MQEKLLICLFLANVNQIPREGEAIPTWNSDFELTAEGSGDVVTAGAALVSRSEMLECTPPLLLLSLFQHACFWHLLWVLQTLLTKSNGRLLLPQFFMLRL